MQEPGRTLPETQATIKRGDGAPGAATPSPARVAQGNVISPIRRGVTVVEPVETPKAPVKPHVALDDRSIIAGYSRISIRKGQILTDPYVIMLLLEAEAPIVPAEGAKFACCPQCKNVFGL